MSTAHFAGALGSSLRALAKMGFLCAGALISVGVATADPAHTEINPRLLRRFVPLRSRFDHPGAPPSAALIQLGRMLYYETRLSRNGELSCNSCHPLDHFGADGKPFSIGFQGKKGRRNAPTVFNAAGHFEQFWDGRAGDVEAQAGGPILNPDEMAMPSKKDVERKLRAIPGYVSAFQAAFPGAAEPVNFDNASVAIAAFERGLSTPSRWDRYLRGDATALTEAEKQGFKVFTNVGCMVCHTGEFLGGSTFQRVGVVEPWPNQQDTGRREVTHSDGDQMVFKVPSLRNIARTAPYFHDASARDLPTAVRMMGRHQLGLELSNVEVDAIVSWFNSLTGEVDAAVVARPTLPN